MSSFLTLYTLASLNFTLPVSEYVTSYISVANVTAKPVPLLYEANHGCTVRPGNENVSPVTNIVTQLQKTETLIIPGKNDLVSGKTKKHPSGRTNKRLLTK